jgi:ferritin
MLTKKMVDALNDQVATEGYASFLYLSMASWCEQQGMGGSAQFFYRQSAEEHMHMMKIFNYILEMDAKAVSPAIKQPPTDFASIRNVFESVYEHEKKVTQCIHDLVDLAIAENDHATHNFLQWYVEEQREEEGLVRDILDKINLIGDGAQSLYFIDKEVDAFNQKAAKAGGGE